MIRIGILGDIGSGKSHIAKQFGFPVFNADMEVSKLYQNSKKCYFKLKKKLPYYITSYPINKTELSRAIIENKNNLKKIVNIIHPEIRSKMNDFIKKNKNKKFVVLDVPLLLENKIYKKKDVLIYVEAKNREIYKRLKKRPNFNPKVIARLKKFQLSLEFKKKKSKYIIKNNFKNNSIKKNVKGILNKIILNA